MTRTTQEQINNNNNHKCFYSTPQQGFESVRIILDWIGLDWIGLDFPEYPRSKASKPSQAKEQYKRRRRYRKSFLQISVVMIRQVYE